MAGVALPPGSGIAPAEAGARKPDDAAKARDAAQQFEALLIGQILHAAHEGGGGWLGSGGGDSAGSCATDMAEQQLAMVLAQRGGLGLADVIAESLRKPE